MTDTGTAITIILGIPVDVVGLWLAALLTLAVYSFLYDDNPVYKVAEHLFVGISAAYGAAIVYHDVLVPKLVNPLFQPALAEPPLEAPKYLLLIPALLGLLIFSRFIPRHQWLSRWPIAFLMGLGAGMAIPRTLQSFVLEQIHGTMQPVWPMGPGHWENVDNLIMIVGVICTLAYFYFSLPHRGLLGGMSRVGIWFLMIAFGAGFGSTVMARISLLIGRVEFLLYDWLPTIGIHLAGPGFG